MSLNIEKLNILLNKKSLTESDYVFILVLVRKELEIFTKGNNFDHVKLFCDWALHMEIDRNNVGSSLVADIHKVLDSDRHSHTDKLIKKVSSSLIGPFRDQLRIFLKENSLAENLVTDEQNWRHFLRNLLEIISPSRVYLKNKHESLVTSTPLKEGMWAEAFAIEKINFDKLADEKSTSNKVTYCLRVFTSDTTQIFIPITPAI